MTGPTAVLYFLCSVRLVDSMKTLFSGNGSLQRIFNLDCEFLYFCVTYDYDEGEELRVGSWAASFW